MKLELIQPDGATPLEPDDIEGLRLAAIATQADLNRAEEANVLSGIAWARRSRRDMLTRGYAAELHKRMFGQVWKWAGTWRTRQTNIGVASQAIQPLLEELLDDARYWHVHRTFEAAEAAVRLHHRMVSIHPFPNGNGRHSRLMADLYMERAGRAPLTWGGASLVTGGETRRAYIEALRRADASDIQPLVAFARS